MRVNGWTARWSIAVLVAAACARTSPPEDAAPVPGEMTAEEHRRAAAAHDLEAEKERSGYDRSAVDWRTRAGEYRPELDGFPSYFYNPTEDHLRRAQAHRDHAEAHRQAAEQLDMRAIAECHGFTTEERGQCPLVGSVESVEDVERGVRISVLDGVDPAGLVAHMRCHAAAAELGSSEMSECPLYLKGVRVERAGDRSVEVTTTDGTLIDALRQRMKRRAEP